MPTIRTIRNAVSPRLGQSFVSTTDNSGGSTSTVKDTAHALFGSSGIPARTWIGGWIDFQSDNLERLITAMNSAGTATISPIMVAARDTAAYEFHSIMQPSLIDACIKRAARNLRYLGYIYPSLVSDGDMELSGVTNWTASVSTLTKSQAAGNTLFSRQSLVVTNAGYAGSASVLPSANTTYELNVYVKPVTGTATIRAYDNTAGASIGSTVSVGAGWQRLHLTFAIPTGCLDLRIRLETTGTAHYNLCLLHRQAERRFALPSWYTNSTTFSGGFNMNEIRAVETVVPAGQTIGSDAFVADAPMPLSTTRFRLDGSPDAGDWFLTMPSSQFYPIRLLCWRPLVIPADDNTTNLPLRPALIEAESILEIYRLKEQMAPGADVAYWAGKRQAWEQGEELMKERMAYFNSSVPTLAWGRKG